MDAANQVTVQFRVVSGAELPRTNLIGSIDPYVRVSLDGNILGETRHLKNASDPVWEEDFFFDAYRDADGRLCGVLRLELYDENRARQDEYVGGVDVDLSELPPDCSDGNSQQQQQHFDYSLVYRDDKRGQKLSRQGRSAMLSLAFLGAIPSWSALVAGLAGCEEEMGLIADEDSRQLYVPLPGGEGAGLYGGIHYLLPRAVHFKLVTVSKHHTGLHLDFKCSKVRSLRVERVSHHSHRRRLMRGLRVYAEASLTNLPLGTDLRRLQLLATKRRAAASHILSETMERAGFPANAVGSGSSSLSYKRIARAMAGSSQDPAAGCVFVPVGRPPTPVLLQLDFGGVGGGAGGVLGGLVGGGGGSGGRPTLRALTIKSGREVQDRELLYDFLTAGCETTTTITESHRRAVKVLGGEYLYTCTAELPGAFDEQQPEVYENAALVAYSLEDLPITSCRLSELFAPPPEADPGEAGFADVFAPENLPQSMGSAAVMVATHGGKFMGRAVGRLSRAVDQLGSMVGGMGIGGGGGASGGAESRGGGGGAAGGSGTGSGGPAVLRALKAQLKLFRGNTKGAADSGDGGSGISPGGASRKGQLVGTECGNDSDHGGGGSGRSVNGGSKANRGEPLVAVGSVNSSDVDNCSARGGDGGKECSGNAASGGVTGGGGGSTRRKRNPSGALAGGSSVPERNNYSSGSRNYTSTAKKNNNGGGRSADGGGGGDIGYRGGAPQRSPYGGGRRDEQDEQEADEEDSD